MVLGSQINRELIIKLRKEGIVLYRVSHKKYTLFYKVNKV